MREKKGNFLPPANAQLPKSICTNQCSISQILITSESCPDLHSRPEFISQTVAVIIGGHVNIRDIHCHTSGDQIKSYLNLQATNQAVSFPREGNDKGST